MFLHAVCCRVLQHDGHTPMMQFAIFATVKARQARHVHERSSLAFVTSIILWQSRTFSLCAEATKQKNNSSAQQRPKVAGARLGPGKACHCRGCGRSCRSRKCRARPGIAFAVPTCPKQASTVLQSKAGPTLGFPKTRSADHFPQ